MIPTTIFKEVREEMVLRVISKFESATTDQRTRGFAWYRSAHDLATMIADGDTQAGAGVLAALSANKSWPLNRRLARQAFENGEAAGHFKDAIRKTERIMSGEDPALVLPMSAKTGQFYRCILDPTDPEPVVIDRHAHDIAVGERYGNTDRGLSTPSRYALLAHVYREAALRVGEIPQVVQAVTWVVQTEE
jgi:hypothetical protein